MVVPRNELQGRYRDLPAIVGLGKAIELAVQDIPGHNARLEALRDRLITGILSTVEHTRLNGHPERRLPGNVNFSFEFIEGKHCFSAWISRYRRLQRLSLHLRFPGSIHVLLAIGLPHEIAHGSLRLTLGENNTNEDIDYVLEVLPQVVQKLREMSPLFNQQKGGLEYV